MPVHHVGDKQRVECVHCHDECGGSVVMYEGLAFCCDGCKTVYTLLQEQGICPTDSVSSSIISSFTLGKTVRFAYLDDDSISEQILDVHIGELSRVTFRLPSMHCASCISLLERLASFHGGIRRSEVNFLRKEITIDFNSNDIPLSHLAELLTKLGYEPEITLSGLTPKSTLTRSLYFKIGLAGFAFGNVMLFSIPAYFDAENTMEPHIALLFGALNILFGTPVLLYSASDWFKGAYRSLRQGALGLDVPVALGTAAIFLRSVYEIVSGTGLGYMDSFTGLVFFLLLGKLAQKKTFDALSFERDYTSYFPLAVRKITADGNETTVPVTTLKSGTLIRVVNHEVIPADAMLVSEFCYVDYSFVTGESAPVEALKGSCLFAGGRIVGTGAEMITVKEVSQSYLTRLWNNAAFRKEKRSALERVSDSFAKYFTVFTLVLAAIAAAFYFPSPAAISVFTAVVIIACPCALTIAAPFALGTAAGVLGRRKFYVKEPRVVLDITTLTTVVFDKTGTLTDNNNTIVNFTGERLISQKEKQMLLSVMKESTHPLSRAVSADVRPNPELEVVGFTEYAGDGIQALADGAIIRCGSAAFVGAGGSSSGDVNSAVYCSIDGEYVGYFSVYHPFRSGLSDLLQKLQQHFGTFLLSGDVRRESVELELLFGGKDALRFEQSPQDKIEFIVKLQDSGKRVLMVGDGLNDAGALRQSDVGVAITSNTGAFTPACDVIADAETLGHLPEIVRFAVFTKWVIIGVFFITVIYNALGLTLAVTNTLSPLAAAILMPVSSLTVIACSTFAVRLGAKWMSYFS